MNNEALDERKMQILKAVIDEYIETFEPVGSRTIAKRSDFGVSSATIRNEMADLEEMGYLSSPHTSAGRIPSAKGYRTYVDGIMGPLCDNPAIAESIITKLEGKMTEYNKLIKACAEIISEMTNYVTIGVTSERDSFVIKAVQLVPVDERHALVVVVSENNIIKNHIVELEEPMEASKLIELSGVMNNTFSGKPCERISFVMLNDISDITGLSKNALYPIIDGIINCIKECKTSEYFTEGASKLLKSPEFDNIDKAREFIDMIQDQEKLENIVKNSGSGDSEVTVTIGSENNTDGMDDYSVVSAKYQVDGVTIGTVNVVGPTRMDYQKVIQSLEYMRKMLEKKAKEEGHDGTSDKGEC